MRTQPRITTVAPADADQARAALQATREHAGPMYFRVSKRGDVLPGLDGRFALGHLDVVREGTDAAILAIGSIAHSALEAAELLEREHGLKASVGVVSSLQPRPGGRDRRAAGRRPGGRHRRGALPRRRPRLVRRRDDRRARPRRAPAALRRQPDADRRGRRPVLPRGPARAVARADRAARHRRAERHGLSAMKITAVIACYRDAPAVPIMHERLVATFAEIGCRLRDHLRQRRLARQRARGPRRAGRARSPRGRHQPRPGVRLPERVHVGHADRDRRRGRAARRRPPGPAGADRRVRARSGARATTSSTAMRVQREASRHMQLFYKSFYRSSSAWPTSTCPSTPATSASSTAAWSTR